MGIRSAKTLFPDKKIMNFSFDVISDLNLTSDDPKFEWDDKPTSLYCIVAGNISNELPVLKQVLTELGNSYHGVFFIDGALEHSSPDTREYRIRDIHRLIKNVRNVIYLRENVVVINGVGLVAINGWCENYLALDNEEEVEIGMARYEDYIYLNNTIKKLQIHIDVRKIVVISNSVPSPQLYYGEYPAIHGSTILTDVLDSDTQHKVSNWVFGTHNKIVDTKLNGIHYLNNSCHGQSPYHPKRVEV